MFDGDDLCCVLVLDKIFSIPIDFEVTLKFELLESSMHEYLVSCLEEGICMQILEIA